MQRQQSGGGGGHVPPPPSVEFSWTVGSASTIEKTETCCSLNALLQFRQIC